MEHCHLCPETSALTESAFGRLVSILEVRADLSHQEAEAEAREILDQHSEELGL